MNRVGGGGTLIAYLDPFTGERHEMPAETDTQMKAAWQKLQQVKDAAEASFKELKPRVLAELDRHGGPINYQDGFVFQSKQNTYDKRLARWDLLDIVGDEDAVAETMKVHVPTAEKLVRRMEQEEALPKGSAKELQSRIKSSRTNPFPVLVPSDEKARENRKQAKNQVKT